MSKTWILRWTKILKNDFDLAKADLSASGTTICNENINKLGGDWLSAELEVIPSRSMLVEDHLFSTLPGNPDIKSNSN
jgi:hypothetical protein